MASAPGTLHKLHLGTSSWTFPDWREVFYPPSLPGRQQLAYYATQFNSVEVNTSFYALPAPATVLQWVESVPPAFTFALKAPRLITHEKRLHDCRQEMRSYLDVLRSLGDMAAPGFLQLPPEFTRAHYGRRLADFLDWVAGELDGLRLAVEVRAADLMTAAFAKFLAERGLSLVVVERTGTPDLYEGWLEALEHSPAAPFLFLRLMGNDRDPLPNDRDLQRPQGELLQKWGERLAQRLAQGDDIYCYIHNPFEGHSPASVRRLRAQIEQHYDLPVWPPPGTSSPDAPDPGQLPLF